MDTAAKVSSGIFFSFYKNKTKKPQNENFFRLSFKLEETKKIIFLFITTGGVHDTIAKGINLFEKQNKLMPTKPTIITNEKKILIYKVYAFYVTTNMHANVVLTL